MKTYGIALHTNREEVPSLPHGFKFVEGNRFMFCLCEICGNKFVIGKSPKKLYPLIQSAPQIRIDLENPISF